MKLQTKLMLSLAGTVFLAVLVTMVIALALSSRSLYEAAENKLLAIRDARYGELVGHLQRVRRDLHLLAIDPTTRAALQAFSQAYAARGALAQSQLRQTYVLNNPFAIDERDQLIDTGHRDAYDQAHARFHPWLRAWVHSLALGDLLLVDTAGHVVYSTYKQGDFATNLIDGPWRQTGLAAVVQPLLNKPAEEVIAFSDFAFYPPAEHRPASFLAQAVFDPEHGLLGVMVVQLSIKRINDLMQRQEGLGQSGETIIYNHEGWMLSDSRFERESTILRRQNHTTTVAKLQKDESGLIEAPDYRHVPSIIALKPLRVYPEAIGGNVRWGVVAKIDRAEALQGLEALRSSLLWAGSGLAMLAILTGVWLARSISRPVLAIQEALSRLSQGEDVTLPELARRDEIGLMAQAAEKFRLLAQQTEQEHWLRDKVSELALIISAENSLEPAAEKLLKRLCALVEAPVAALWLADGQGGLRRQASHGLARRNPSADRFAVGEGVIGQCAHDRQPIVLSPLPEGLCVIVAGLGEFQPRELALYPIVHKDEVLAVIELASLGSFSPRQHELLAAVGNSLGLHLANLRAAEHNLELLAASRRLTDELERQQEVLNDRNASLENLTEELKSQTEELRAQTEELKASQEELRAQQDEMARKNEALELQGQALEEARREAEAKAAELQKANQYKSEFLANMSHELRTPLNSILILAQSLAENLEGNLTPDQAEAASVIHESGQHLLTLINDILDLSKIEAGRLEIVSEDFLLDDLLAYLRRIFAPLAEKKGLDFRIELSSDVPESLHGDRQRVTQVLTNLLSNAVKFTEQGKVRLTVTLADGGLSFAVEDTGIGIPQDKLEYIFGAFQQLDGRTSRKYGGSGLGLAIARRLTELMGGRIEVRSQLGQGSCFTVWLPVLPSPGTVGAPPAPARKVSPLGTPSPNTVGSASSPASARVAPTGASVLVVEDDERLTRILSRLIDALGFRAICVGSGEAALEELQRSQPSGVLLDLGLPGMTGMEVLRRMKAEARWADIPVYIMSGAPDTGEAQLLGAEGFLKKPVTREVIANALAHIARQAAAAASPARSRVLVVEDDAATVSALERLFAGDAIDFVACATGQEGLQRLAEAHFDAVILDLGLSDMTGFEWLQAAQTREGLCPPVIVYSARELDREALIGLRECASAVVCKGVHAQERLREEVLAALAKPRPSPPPSTPTPVAGQHLLLVDDDLRNLYALSRVLRSHGYRVSLAENGERALALLRSDRFDAVLTDIMMPNMDGYELIRRIRSLGYGALPIVAVTAKAMPGDAEQCLAAGANDYLTKPVEIDRLIAVLRRLTLPAERA